LKAYAKFKSDAMHTQIGKYKFITVWSDARHSLNALEEQLRSEGITYTRDSSGGSLSINNGLDLWTGKIVSVSQVDTRDFISIPLAQPQGHLVKSLFDSTSDFEPSFVKEQLRRRAEADGEEKYPGADPAEFYDFTGWNPALATNVDAALTVVDPTPNLLFTISHGRLHGAVGYIARPGEGSSLIVSDLEWKGVHVDVATQPLAGIDYPAGSFIIYSDRNSDHLEDLILSTEDARKSWSFDPLNSSYPVSGRQGAGSESVRGLSKMNVGVLFGDDASPTAYSGIWFELEKTLHLPFTPLTKGALNEDLSQYSCLIFPRGQYQIGDKVRDWINNGGCAIALGAQGWAVSDFAHLEEVKGNPGELPGSLFRAELNPRSFLCYGYTPHEGATKTEMAVLVEGNTFYKAKAEGGGAVVISKEEDAKKLLSGWEWPDDTEKNLAGTVWVHDQPVGRGHVIIFMQDPTDRAMWPGYDKMLLNAILLGPSRP
jgi:hypothetical protein